MRARLTKPCLTAAASIVKARDSKLVEGVFDLTLVLADVAEKALAQVKQGAVELLPPRMERSAAEALAAKLAGGHWTHDYALTAQEAHRLSDSTLTRHFNGQILDPGSLNWLGIEAYATQQAH
jgi:hypothetical protein